MKIKINKDGKKETYSTINSWSDVSLESWMKLIEVETGSQAIQAEETIAALSDIPKTLIKELSIADVAVIMSKIAEMQSKQDSSLKKIFKIEGIEYGMHPNLDLLTLGEYADIETFIKNGIEQNMPEVLAVLFRPVTERKEEAYTIESYDGEITIRTEIMKKMSAEQVQAALFFFLEFRKGVIEDFAIVFNGTDSGDSGAITDGNFAERWGWFGVMHRLCNQNIVNLDAVSKLNLLECLTWLSYETDLNESQKVKRDDK